MLARRHEETMYIVIPSTVRMLCWPVSDSQIYKYVQNIDFLYNVQHDCPLAKCTASGKEPVMQERVESSLIKNTIEHKPFEHFVINTHAFHNAHLLRATLPRSLVAPILLHRDRQAKHTEIAGSL